MTHAKGPVSLSIDGADPVGLVFQVDTDRPVMVLRYGPYRYETADPEVRSFFEDVFTFFRGPDWQPLVVPGADRVVRPATPAIPPVRAERETGPLSTPSD